MIYLALSILASSLIFVIFKLFPKYKVQTLFAIIVNYLTAGTVGLLFYEDPVKFSKLPQETWFWGATALGLLFILIFNLMALTSQKLGVAVASVATKMSLVIPVIFGVILYKEVLSLIEIVGIIIALLAVYLASAKEKVQKVKKLAFLLPLSVFVGSGLIDTSIKYFQDTYVQEAQYPLFSAVVFASAAFLGLLLILIRSVKNKLKINLKNVVAGICLGVPNYFSIYFLLKALQNPSFTSASIFTINNVAIVMLSTVLGIILFKEVLSTKNWIGASLAILSIILVALGNELTTIL